MKEIVLDTNVVVSGLINAFGAPGKIVERLRNGDLSLCVDDRVLLEYREVLSRPELSRWIRTSDRDAIIEYVQGCSRHVLCTENITGLPDRSDAPFLETAVTADIPLITGNIKHFPEDTRHGVLVLSPAAFIELSSK